MTADPELVVPPHLNGRHRHTYAAIFSHPVAHNLEWHDVRSLLAAVGDVTDEPNGAVRVCLHGRELVLHPPKHKDVSAEAVRDLRRFLDPAGGPPADPAGPASHLLVVIDHHGAKVYRTLFHGAVPEHLVPYDPHGFRRHLHSHNEETDGHRAPERRSYYEAVAATLRGADQILLLGSGTGESSALEQLLADLRHHHADVEGHVIGTAVVDVGHTTEGELLARAREFFTSINAPDGVPAPAPTAPQPPSARHEYDLEPGRAG